MNKAQVAKVADKVLRKRFFVILPLLFFALAGWFWLRPISITPLTNHGSIFDNKNGVFEVGARPEWCEILNERNGYLLFSGNVELRNLNVFQGFFQTDEEEVGIFYDFDNGPRIGISQSDGNTSRTQIGTRFDSKVLTFLILIRQDGSITYFENSKRSEIFVGPISPSCNSVKIGMGNESQPLDGEISLSVSFGTDSVVASKLVSEYDSQFHTNKVKAYEWSMNALICALILLAFGNPFKKRGPIMPITESEST